MPNILEVQNLSLSYYSPEGETKALENISFSVKKGEFLSIVGPSGSGKSTLLSVLAGILTPTEGCVSVAEGAKTGYMLQKDHLFEWRTIEKNILLGLELTGNLTTVTREYALKLMEQYGLSGFRNRYPSQLSGGMRQRAALIRTLALRPEILLLDEPFSALDYQTRLHVSDDIVSIIKSQRKTAILVTHDISEAVALSDRVIVLSKRPAHIKAQFGIGFSLPPDNSIEAREAPEFKDYFNKIWKELDF
ncbi:MAG: ABC transporter ATP-binding protein [Firmicutes bacterium]|nr:ABC transporter ATP-binding protein [Bacillota bacterium]